MSHNMTKEEWAEFIKDAQKAGIHSPTYYLKKAAELPPIKRNLSKIEDYSSKDLPYLTAEDFEAEARRMEAVRFEQALEECSVEPKARIPEKFEAFKCIEYILDNGVTASRLNDDIIIYQPSNGVWYYLRSKIGRQILYNNIPIEVMERFDLDKCSKIYDSIEVYPRLRTCTIEPDPESKYLLNFLDGVYDCRTGEIYPHDPGFMFFYCIQARASDIENDYDSPLFRSYLENSLQNDEAKITTLQEIMGVALSTIRDQKISFFLLGKSNSGKSVILNVLGMFLSGFVSNISFSQLNNQFAPALLLGKWLNISGEMSDLSDNKVQTFKNVVGNDSIMTSFKGKDGFALKNNALFIFGANSMPTVTKTDQAYFNRLRILSYDVAVPKEKWVDNLAERMFHEEKGYLLRFAIDGLLRFIKNGMELTYINMSDDLVESYKYSSNSFIEFANASIRYCPGQKLKSSDIRSAYERFCKRNDMKALAANICSSILKELFDTERTTVGHSGDKGFTNLTLINNFQNDEDE